VINIPIAKHHSLAKLTMAMKNWMGVMGGLRRQIHQRHGREPASILPMAIKPTLTILDAVRNSLQTGPQGGNPGDVRKLDTVISRSRPGGSRFIRATLFGMKGSDLGYVRLEKNRDSVPWTSRSSG